MNKELPQGLKLLTIWLLILLVVFMGFKAWEHQRAQSLVSIDGGAIVLKRGPDGHFHWPGEVNGLAVDFLVDTGATSTALPQALAERAGLVAEASVSSQTAAGVTRGYRARANIALRGGVQAERLAVTVLPALGAPLLGMDILAKLDFKQQDGTLHIRADR
ncbi:retropepsin-like aspartic protease family protein [Roseateles oligotrophus]|uniref:TIGR02281 family clan AA aspartic protease n=1 Tax=Roseateles oligotrophus TaxID=1769250 RepID=A0ABT2YDA4_9BURK|nr:TIGR02281 family clan AA aspartic protease [Roseateles oligotrophus]MCV2368014.1 TIGR02281 family clan AA aspartic protease [Roseateles oligotrophus]